MNFIFFSFSKKRNLLISVNIGHEFYSYSFTKKKWRTLRNYQGRYQEFSSSKPEDKSQPNIKCIDMFEGASKMYYTEKENRGEQKPKMQRPAIEWKRRYSFPRLRYKPPPPHTRIASVPSKGCWLAGGREAANFCSARCVIVQRSSVIIDVGILEATTLAFSIKKGTTNGNMVLFPCRHNVKIFNPRFFFQLCSSLLGVTNASRKSQWCSQMHSVSLPQSLLTVVFKWKNAAVSSSWGLIMWR